MTVPLWKAQDGTCLDCGASDGESLATHYEIQDGEFSPVPLERCPVRASILPWPDVEKALTYELDALADGMRQVFERPLTNSEILTTLVFLKAEGWRMQGGLMYRAEHWRKVGGCLAPISEAAKRVQQYRRRSWFRRSWRVLMRNDGYPIGVTSGSDFRRLCVGLLDDEERPGKIVAPRQRVSDNDVIDVELEPSDPDWDRTLREGR